MTASVCSIASRTAEQPAASSPRDFTAKDKALYREVCAVLSAGGGMTEPDRLAAIGFVRATRAAEDWRNTARQLRRRMKADSAALVLAAKADAAANAAGREARAVAASLKLTVTHRSERAVVARKASAPVVEAWDLDD